MPLLLKTAVAALLASIALLPSLSALEPFQAKSAEQQTDSLPWPPLGPSWETNPSVAFERAHREEKVVMACVATEN